MNSPAPAPAAPSNPLASQESHSAAPISPDATVINPLGGPTIPANAPLDSVPLIDDQFNFNGAWHEQALQGEYAGFQKTAAKFTSLPELVKGYASLEKHRTVPGQDAAPEAVEAFRKVNQIPNTLEDYQAQVKLPDPGEGREYPPEFLKQVAEFGHQHNLTPTQLSAAAAFQESISQQAALTQETAQAQQTEQKFQELFEKWGPTKDAKLDNARAAAGVLGLDHEDPDIGGNVKLVEALANLHQQLDEDTLRSAAGTATGSIQGGTTTGTIAKADDIVQNSANPLYDAYHDPSHPQHTEAHQQVDLFYAQGTGFRG